MDKSVLVINRSAPYGQSNSREALDIALTCGAFEFPVSLIFMDDGVFQLLDNQQPELIEQKNTSNSLKALPMYDVDQIFVCAQSLEQRGIRPQDLCLSAELIREASDIQRLIRSHSAVLSF